MGLEAIAAPAKGKGHGEGRRSGGVLLVVVEGGEELGAARIRAEPDGGHGGDGQRGEVLRLS